MMMFLRAFVPFLLLLLLVGVMGDDKKKGASPASKSQKDSSASSSTSSAASSAPNASSSEPKADQQINVDSGNSSSASGHNSSSSSSSSSSSKTEVVQGKKGKKVITKTVVTEVEEETEEERRAKEAAEMAANLTSSQMVLTAYELRLKEERERAEHEQMRQLMMRQNAEALVADTNGGHINLHENVDYFTACSDLLPLDACDVLKPLCAVSDTARAIRFLRERSDYILYLNQDIQSHIDYVKSTVQFQTNAFYAASLLNNLENIKNLLSSASKTAPLLQLILDEDSEEELEQILNAHLQFKQQCEAYKSTCHLKVNVTTDEREQACHLYDEKCCCDDGLKFSNFYKALAAAEQAKKAHECPKARALAKSTRRLVEAACPHTCGSCPTRFKLKEYSTELVECVQKKEHPAPPKPANVHVLLFPQQAAPQLVSNALTVNSHVVNLREPSSFETVDGLANSPVHVQVHSVPLNVRQQQASKHPNLSNLAAYILAHKQQQREVPLRQLAFGLKGRGEGLLEEEDDVNDDVVLEK